MGIILGEYKMKNLDSTDSKILKMLTESGRDSFDELSKKLDMNEKTVKERIRKLEDEGIIKGYTAKVNPETVSQKVTAFLKVETELPNIQKMARKLRDFNKICEIHKTANGKDVLMKIRAKSRKSISRFVEQKLGTFENVKDVKITMAIETYKEKLVEM